MHSSSVYWHQPKTTIIFPLESIEIMNLLLSLHLAELLFYLLLYLIHVILYVILYVFLHVTFYAVHQHVILSLHCYWKKSPDIHTVRPDLILSISMIRLVQAQRFADTFCY